MLARSRHGALALKLLINFPKAVARVLPEFGSRYRLWQAGAERGVIFALFGIAAAKDPFTVRAGDSVLRCTTVVLLICILVVA